MNNKNISPLIDAGKVRSLNNAKVIIVDARGGADAYKRYMEGHLDGAVFMDLETDLSGRGPDAAIGGRHPLPDVRKFGVRLGEVGITPSSHVLVYDDKAGANAAARFWWMMRAVGHSRIQVIDGGLKALQQEGYSIVKTPEREGGATTPYPVSSWSLPLADIVEVERARNQAGAVVIDVREGYRYRGESEPIDLIAGHIPGAINIPYLDNLDDDGKFRDANSLAAHYRNVIGNRPAENIIVHCGSGVTACHTLLAMETAGLEPGKLYVGSWSEWSRNQKPIASGDKP